MKPLDFLQEINDIDEALIQSSVAFLQEDNMDKGRFRKTGSTLSKIILVAAVVAGVVGVTAVAAETFPSIFSQLEREYAEIATEFPGAQEEADLYKRAAEANETFEAEYVPLPELDESQIIIGEKYYDGKNLLIAYRIDSSVTKAQFGYGPDSEGFEKLKHEDAIYGTNGDWPDSYEERLKKGYWTQEDYDANVAQAEAIGAGFIRSHSLFDAVYSMYQNLSEEEYVRAIQELEENGHVGVVVRVMSIGDHILVEGEDCLVPNVEGYVWWEDVTEYGRCIKSDAFDESLPEKFRDRDTLTLTLKVRATNIYYYIDMDTGCWKDYESIGEIQVPVTLTKTPKE